MTPNAAPALAATSAEVPSATPERRLQFEWPKQYGRVVAAEDQSPIAGATIGAPRTVTLAGYTDVDAIALDDMSELTTADERGEFELEPSLPDAILCISAPGFGSVLCDRSWLGDMEVSPLVIDLERGASLRGSVLDWTGAPLADVEVGLIAYSGFATFTHDRDDGRFFEKMAVVRERTDARGGVVFNPLAPDVPFQAYLWRNERPCLVDLAPLNLAPGEEGSQEWRLAVGATVRGRAVDDEDRAVADVELELIEIATIQFHGSGLPTPSASRQTLPRTDADGRFVIPDVVPGIWLLKGERRLSTPTVEGVLPSLVQFNVAAGVEEVDVNLPIRRGLTIRGKVLGPDGDAAQATLSVSGAELGPLPFLGCDTDGDGRFALGPFESGSYHLVAEPKQPRFARSEPKHVVPGSEEVVLRLRAGAIVRPRAIRKSDGEPVAAHFTLFAEGKWEPLPFTSLSPGRYDLVATTDDGAIGFERGLEVREGAMLDDVRVNMVPGARLVLRSSQTQGDREPVRLFAAEFCFASATLEGTTRMEFVVPAAPIRIARLFDIDPTKGQFELKFGETREVVWPPVK